MGTENLKEKVFSGLFWKFAERFTAQIVTFVVSIVLARLLMPKDYGAVSLVMVFITIANVFVSSGFGTALIQKKDADDIDFSSVLYVNIGFSIIIYFILYIAAPYIAGFYKMPVLTPVVRVLALRIIVAAVNSVQHAYVSKKMMFRRFFWSTLFGTLLSGVVGIIMAYMGCGVWAIVGQYLTNTIVDTVVLWFTINWRPKLVLSFKRVKGLLSFGWKLLVSGLIDTTYNQLTNLIIGRLYTANDLAYYSKGKQYPQLIVTNINTSIGSVLFPAISQEQDNRPRVKSMMRRAMMVSSFVMWPLMFGLAAVSQNLVLIMLTEKWLPCVPYLCISCFVYGMWPIQTANLQAMQAVGRSDLFLKLEIAKKIMGLSVLMVSMHYGVMAMALSTIGTTIMSSFINAFPNRKLFNYSYFEQIKDILPSFFLSAAMGGCVWSINLLNWNVWLTIIIQILLGIVIYVAGAKLFKMESFDYILNTLKGIKRGKK